MYLCFLPASANCTLRAVQKKRLSKHINMGSPFEDLADIYFFVCNFKEKKEKLASVRGWDRSIALAGLANATRQPHVRAVQPENVRCKLG